MQEEDGQLFVTAESSFAQLEPYLLRLIINRNHFPASQCPASRHRSQLCISHLLSDHAFIYRFWLLALKKEQVMTLLESRMLNRIFWAMWQEAVRGNWKFRYSGLYNLNFSRNDFIVITLRGIKCLGHVAWLREKRKADKMFTPGFRLSWPAWGLEGIYVPK